MKLQDGADDVSPGSVDVEVERRAPQVTTDPVNRRFLRQDDPFGARSGSNVKKPFAAVIYEFF